MDDRDRQARCPGGDAEEEAGGVEAEAEAAAGNPGIAQRSDDRVASPDREDRIGVEEEKDVSVGSLPSTVHLPGSPRRGVQKRGSVTPRNIAGRIGTPAVDHDHLAPPGVREELMQTTIELIGVVQNRYDNGYLQQNHLPYNRYPSDGSTNEPNAP